MPRKRPRVVISSYEVPTLDPADRSAVEDQHLVRHALVDFDEFSVLSEGLQQQLVSDVVDAVRFYHAGVKARKRGVSDQALAGQILLSDIGRAMERVGIGARRWRKQYDNGGGESIFFQVARAVADVSGIALPKDLTVCGKTSKLGHCSRF